jgi:hypothetical protein
MDLSTSEGGAIEGVFACDVLRLLWPCTAPFNRIMMFGSRISFVSSRFKGCPSEIELHANGVDSYMMLAKH